MNQARKDTTGIKLEVNERFVLFLFLHLKLVMYLFVSCICFYNPHFNHA